MKIILNKIDSVLQERVEQGPEPTQDSTEQVPLVSLLKKWRSWKYSFSMVFPIAWKRFPKIL